MPKSSDVDRAVPQNLEAERALLGSILLDNASLNVALELISKEDFFTEGHRLAFGKMLDLSEKNRSIDTVTLCEELSKEGLLERSGGPGYLSSLTDGVPIGTTAAVAEYASIVKEKSTIRRVINASQSLIARCLEGLDDPETLINLAQEQLFDIADHKARRGFLSLEDIMKRDTAYFAKLFEGEVGVTGIAMGFRELDAMTRGLHPGELSIVAGRPSLGKTSLALSISVEAAKRGIPVGLFSVETEGSSIATRILAMEAEINLHRVASGFASRKDWTKLTRAIGRVKDLPLYVDDTSDLSPAKLRAKARRLRQEHGAALFVIDYVQLMTTEKKFDSRNAEVAYLSRSLKALAKDEKVPVVALSQLSRESERGRKRKPRLADLRDSGTLEQDADLVMLLYRGAKEEAAGSEAGVSPTTLIVAKQRNGPTGEVRLGFLKGSTKFVELASEGSISVP